MTMMIRRSGWGIGAALAVLALGGGPAHAQRVPLGVPFNPGLNPNPYVNPVAAVSRLATVSALRTGIGTPLGMVGYPFMARAALANAYGNRLGYAALLNGYGGYGLYGGGYGLAGGYGLYGYGMFTQWMLNPYTGYLDGAANITRANSDYQKGIQQAKLMRQSVIHASIENRRAMIEQAEWERAHMPDPEKIRQLRVAQELDRARHDPPLGDIRSGRALNSLLQYLIAQQGQGAKGPDVPLSEDTLKSINLNTGDTRGNVGLLKDGGRLQWPQTLQGGLFREPREEVDRLMRRAFQAVQNNSTPPENVLNDLAGDLKKLDAVLENNVTSMSIDQQIEARRFLVQLKDALTALRDPNVVNHFNGNWAPKVRNVAELVQFMRDKGLQFAEATPGDEGAYTALYYALRDFDARMPRVPVGYSAENK